METDFTLVLGGDARGKSGLPDLPPAWGARGWARRVLSHTYADSPFSKLAVESHLDFVLVSGPLIKGVTAVEGWAVQMQANGRLCVAYVLHTVQANGVYTSKGMQGEAVLVGRINDSSDAWKNAF